MEKKYDILIAGGDRRLSYLAKILKKHGFSVLCFGTETESSGTAESRNKDNDPLQRKTLGEAIACASYFCGGIPFVRGDMVQGDAPWFPMKLSDFYPQVQGIKTLFGGGIPKETVEYCRQCGISCVDFMENESFVVDNAVLTCEGVIAEAQKEKPYALHGKCALVLGYGRCGKILAEKLKNWPMRVTVCARDPVQRSYAEAFGMESVSFEKLPDILPKQEYIFNTIPYPVLGKRELEAIRSDTVILDLASGEGCVSRDLLSERKIRIRSLPGLPGRYAPAQAAEKMAELIEQNIGRKGWDEG